MEDLKLAEKNFYESLPEYYYSRVIDAPEGIVVDFGSHVKFLLITGVSYEDYTNYYFVNHKL